MQHLEIDANDELFSDLLAELLEAQPGMQSVRLRDNTPVRFASRRFLCNLCWHKMSNLPDLTVECEVDPGERFVCGWNCTRAERKTSLSGCPRVHLVVEDGCQGKRQSCTGWMVNHLRYVERHTKVTSFTMNGNELSESALEGLRCWT